MVDHHRRRDRRCGGDRGRVAGKPLLNTVFALSGTFPYLVATMLAAAVVVGVRTRGTT